MKKIISFIICITLTFGCITSFSSSDVIGIVEGCKYDTYTEDGRENVSFENNEVMLAGTVYNRTAYFRFDISGYINSGFEGCVLNLTLRNITPQNKITIHGYDFDTKKESGIISTVNLSDTGKLSQGFNISDYAKANAALGKTEIGLSLHSSSDTTTIFSTQSSSKADRPHLKITASKPFVKGQIEMELPELSAVELEAKLKNTVSNGHPRILATKEQFDRVRENAFGKDALMTETYAKIKAIATDYLAKKPQPIGDLAVSYIGRGIEASWTIMPFCAFVYLIEGDEAYAQRAWQETEYFLNLENWGTYQYLDNNQAALVVAICYDWLYDWLTPERRELLVQNLREKHLDSILDYYNNHITKKFASRYTFLMSDSNHGVLNNSSIFIQALAIAEHNPAYSAEIMSHAMHYMNVPLYQLYPDSMWPEGYDYWGFVGPMALRAVMSMKAAFGDCLGYEKSDVFMNCAYHPIYLSTAGGTFTFNDGHLGVTKNVVFDKYIYGVIADNKPLQKYSLENDDLAHPFFCLYYDPSADASSFGDQQLQKDMLFRNVDLAIMRSSWEGDQYLFGGMLVQDSMNKLHRHMNSGSLAFHALGDMWITNCGADSYSLPGYSSTNWFDYYCKRAEGSSCIVINPSAEGGQTNMAGDIIDEFESKDRGAFAISDLTDTYRLQGAKSYKRGVMLGDDRTSFTVQDELELKSESEVYSFINFYKSDIQLSDDGKTAVISKGDKKLYMQVYCDEEYEISVMDSVPLPKSPDMPGQSKFEDIKKIAFRFEKTDGYNMTVKLTPYLAEEDFNRIVPVSYTPLSQWSVEEGELPVTKRLESLNVNGTLIDNFHPEARFYEIITEASEADVTAVAPADCTAEIKKGDRVYTVLLKKDGEVVNSYVVRLTEPQKEPELEVKDLSGLTAIGIASVSATDNDGNTPDGAIDNDPNTRWSASGEHSITFKLAKPANVATLGIAFYNGFKRVSYFDIQISTDGRTWKTVSEGNASCGFSDQMEYFDIKPTAASYIRLLCHGNSVNEWNSISEFDVYSK